jgi:uncharacterized membrane protein
MAVALELALALPPPELTARDTADATACNSTQGHVLAQAGQIQAGQSQEGCFIVQ